MATSGGERVITASPIPIAGGRVVAAPFQFYLDGADHLRVEGWNTATGAAVQVFGRFLNEQGQVEVFAHVLPLTNERLRATEDFAMGRGFILNLVATVTGATSLIGQTFARLSVIRGFTGATIVLGTLLQGYVTSQQGLGWPGSPIQASTEGGGYPRAITGTTPPAGASVSEACPTGARWDLQAFHCGLTADATVVTRTVYLTTTRGGVHRFAQTHPQQALASQTPDWFWAGGVPTETLINNWYVTAGLPTPTILLGSDEIRVLVLNIQAGDQIRDVTYLVEEWLEIE